MTVRFGQCPHQFRGRMPRDCSGVPLTSLFLPPTSREDLWLNDFLNNTHAAQAVYIYKHPYLLRDSNSSTNIYVFSGIGIQAQRCSNQCR
ncbi:hypothetical protein TNCV_3659441 [Trichonephila clavipes]|nr:hypothetical protein TNCV_3659441 [Trichonephila clavipes]